MKIEIKNIKALLPCKKNTAASLEIQTFLTLPKDENESHYSLAPQSVANRLSPPVYHLPILAIIYQFIAPTNIKLVDYHQTLKL